jgi:hypothetical protein
MHCADEHRTIRSRQVTQQPLLHGHCCNAHSCTCQPPTCQHAELCQGLVQQRVARCRGPQVGGVTPHAHAPHQRASLPVRQLPQPCLKSRSWRGVVHHQDEACVGRAAAAEVCLEAVCGRAQVWQSTSVAEHTCGRAQVWQSTRVAEHKCGRAQVPGPTSVSSMPSTYNLLLSSSGMHDSDVTSRCGHGAGCTLSAAAQST